MGREAALKPNASECLAKGCRRACCRFAADRRQARLLRPSARIKSRRLAFGVAVQIKSAREQVRSYRECVVVTASAEGVGALGGNDGSDGARSGPKTKRLGVSGKRMSPGSLPLRSRSSASQTPTAFGQNQRAAVRLGLRSESKAAALRLGLRYKSKALANKFAPTGSVSLSLLLPQA
jgi:hypothetical protein